MKRLSLILIVAGILALGGQAFAEICAIDPVPAATLLVPYFEVDLDAGAGQGVTTFFSINNASAAPALAHVIFWTDWSAPTIDFDIYLSGYDVVGVNVYDVFQGNIPITADAPRDGSSDSISPHGDNIHWDDTDPTTPAFYTNVQNNTDGFTNCGNFFPFFVNPVIQGTAFDRLVNGHTGNPVSSLAFGCGNTPSCCLGDDHGDNVARGYITIDNVSECSLVLDPGTTLTTPPYFVDGGQGIATNINQLWGDWFLIDPANNFAQGDTLVHIEADSAFNADLGAVPSVPPNPNNYTFYGRYTQALNGNDNREPLGTTWGTRFLNGGAFDQTQLVVWRDSTADNLLPGGARCGVGPDWFPLNENEVIVWNEQEDAVEICFFTGGVVSPPDDDDPPCFPYETGRYNWGDAPLDVPFQFGWTFLNLNIPDDNPTGDVDFPAGALDGGVAQSYVFAIHSALGLFSVGLSAIEMTSACDIFADPQINGAMVNGGTNSIPFF